MHCPVCGEPDCPAWRDFLDEHDDDLEDEDEPEDELEYERRQRG